MEAESITVDLEALSMLDHACTGCSRAARCCCAHYDICITAHEMERTIGYLDHIAAYCSHLRIDDGYDNVFEEIDRDLFRIDSSEDGLCVFAYRQGRQTRCALHRVAMELGLAVETIKPHACLLWPLALTENAPYILAVHVDAFQFRCNHQRPRQASLHPSVADIVATVFGPLFAREVGQSLDLGLSTVEITLDARHAAHL